MATKTYSSFEEINRDLKILKLRMDISQEEVKLSFNKTKSTFSPLSSIASVLGSIAQKAIVVKVIDKVLGYPRVRKKAMK